MERGQYKVVICDDDALFLNLMQEKITGIFEKKKKKCEIYSYAGSREMLGKMPAQTDLYFLDIDMPGMSGMEVAKKIMVENAEAVIIFVSNHEDAVFEAIHYAPFRFIRKAYIETELPEALGAWEKECRKRERNRAVLEIKTREGIAGILIQNIICIESRRHYLRVKCVDGEYETRGKLADYEVQLKEYGFVRMNIGYLIHCRWIKQIKTGQVILKTDEIITISRGRFEEVKHAYMAYVRGSMNGDY